MDKVFIIAEAGVNHNGDLTLAKRLVDVASEAKVDAIKFQTFKSEELVSIHAQKAAYQKKATNKDETQLEMLKRLELSEEDYKELISYCVQKKILFLSTPFDLPSIRFLESTGIEIYKIPSGEITNLPYLREIGRLQKKIILSTGMSTIDEIAECIQVLYNQGSKDITLLHCSTEYPTPMEDVNLNAMLTLKNKFQLQVGYSDHTLGIEVPIAAVALGAKVIEKHITLDKTMEGPDHKASLEPQELKAMVVAIRNIEMALGNGEKVPSPSEIKNMAVARKSIVAAKPIKLGERFTEENLTVKRPGIGICPMKWDKVIGGKSKKNYEKDELIGDE